MEKRIYKAVLFDFDGTVADTMPDIFLCMQNAYIKEGILGVDPKPEQMGPPLKEFLKILTPDLKKPVLEKIANNFKKEYDVSAYPNTKIYPGIKHVFNILRKNKVELYLVTMKRKIPTMRFIKIRKLKCFKKVLSPDSICGKSLTKAEMIGCLLRSEGILPKDALYVGDAATDITSAHANGVKAAAVTYGYGAIKQFKKAGPDYIIKSIKELPEIVLYGSKKNK